jgi:MoxR-like ATPase
VSLAAEDPAPASTAASLERLRAVIRHSVVIREEALDLALVALLARGHLLLEDVPGVGKTLLARTLARAIGGEFRRIQFTPDLLPADITGGNVFDQRGGDFHFRHGPIFANVVLADEINRATPRAQSSLLEAMGERGVSVDGTTHTLPDPFIVLATQNPIEEHGTFPLPESELDRFTVLLRLGRPDEAQSREILRRHEHGDAEGQTVERVLGPAEVLALQDEVLAVRASEAARAYVAAIALATREHPAVGLPASPRASVALLRTAQAVAVMAGRDHVLPDDVKRVAAGVLGHRLASAGAGEEVVGEILDRVPVPLST